MKVWAITAHKAPLECVELPDLHATGSEVVVEVTHCGVCHSDLHMWHGGYKMGGDKFLSVADRGLKLPAAPGHEMVGRVVEIGPDAKGVTIGDSRVVYPWIGCGACDRCATGDDNMCTRQRSLGAVLNGGFARQVKVPHPRYLLDYSGIPASLAATYACSGITTYSAIRKIGPLRKEQPVVLIGAGGLGHAAIAMLKAFGHETIVVIDTSAEKRAAALAAGASLAVDGGDAAKAELLALPVPIAAVIDFVGNDITANTAMAILPKGGKLILVGIGGGEIVLSVSAAIFKAQTVQGSLTGSLNDLHDVLELARSGKLKPSLIIERPKTEANAAMHDLEAGLVTGRQVLIDS